MIKVKKYELTETFKVVGSTKVFKIKALIDFGNVKKGDLGGFVEKEDNLSQAGDAWVADNAQVYNDVRISGNALVAGNARIFGNARISGNALVAGDAWVFENAFVFGNAFVTGNVRIYNNARIFGHARICDSTRISGETRIYGNVDISGNAQIYGKSRISGDACISKTPFQIQGSKHFVNMNGDLLQIGCQLYSIHSWKEHFKKIGKAENYSKEEIKEYKLYIDLAKKLMELN